MSQYVPLGYAKNFSDINRRITPREYNKVLDYMENLNLDGYVQELSSAKKCYIPDFNIDEL